MLNWILVIILVLAGVGLMLIEIVFIPGIGLAGVGSAACLVGAVGLAYWLISPLAGHIILALSLVLSIVALVVFLKSRTIEKMGLQSKIDTQVSMPSAGKRMEEMKKGDE